MTDKDFQIGDVVQLVDSDNIDKDNFNPNANVGLTDDTVASNKAIVLRKCSSDLIFLVPESGMMFYGSVKDLILLWRPPPKMNEKKEFVYPFITWEET